MPFYTVYLLTGQYWHLGDMYLRQEAIRHLKRPPPRIVLLPPGQYNRSNRCSLGLCLLTGQYWHLGEMLCDLWLSLDYTVCLQYATTTTSTTKTVTTTPSACVQSIRSSALRSIASARSRSQPSTATAHRTPGKSAT